MIEKTTRTCVYSYGALDPTDGAEEIERLLRRSHDYKIALIRIERERRARYRAIEKSVVSEATLAALDAAEKEYAEAEQAIRDARAGIARAPDAGPIARKKLAGRALSVVRKRYREEATPIREAASLVKVARDAEKKARRENQKRDRDDARVAAEVSARGAGATRDIALRLCESDAIAASASRVARGSSGLPWGCYTLIEDEVLQAAAKVPGDPDAPRWRRYEQEGRIGSAQLVGGLPASQVESDRRFAIRLLPMPEPGATRRICAGRDASGIRQYREVPICTGSKRAQVRRHAVAEIRLAEGRVARWPVLVTRALPPGSIIKRAWAIRTRVGSRLTWRIQVTVEEPVAPPIRKPGDPIRVAAVEVGWRASAGDRVGFVLDESGEGCPIETPWSSHARGKKRREEWASGKNPMKPRPIDPPDPALVAAGWTQRLQDRLDSLDGIRKVKAKAFDAMVLRLRAWLAERGDQPEWLKDATVGLHAWKRSGRLVSLLRAWMSKSDLSERMEGDWEILRDLLLWEKQDRHLWDWEAMGRRRSLGLRKQHYREEAMRIARAYDVILLPSTDLREFARGPKVEEGTPAEGRDLRRAQRVCAPAEWRDTVCRAVERLGGIVVGSVGKSVDDEAVQAAIEAARQSGRKVVVLVDPAYDTVTCHLCGKVEEWPDPAALHHRCGCGALWDRDPNACTNRLRRAGFDPDRKIQCRVVEQAAVEAVG